MKIKVLGSSGGELPRSHPPSFLLKSTEFLVLLGLSFVKEVVNLHEGRILVQSEPRKGSIFSVLLPIRARLKL
jgi:C4-dicarboxylate-specific signal transduction histidine kinase